MPFWLTIPNTKIKRNNGLCEKKPWVCVYTQTCMYIYMLCVCVCNQWSTSFLVLILFTIWGCDARYWLFFCVNLFLWNYLWFWNKLWATCWLWYLTHHLRIWNYLCLFKVSLFMILLIVKAPNCYCSEWRWCHSPHTINQK